MAFDFTKNPIGMMVAVLVVIVLGVVVMVFSASQAELIDIVDTSDSQIILSNNGTATTLSPVGEGITSSSFTKLNETYLDMSAVDEVINLPEDFLEDRQSERSIVIWSIRYDEDSVGGLLGDWYSTDETNYTQLYLGPNNQTALKIANDTSQQATTRSQGLPADGLWHQVVGTIKQSNAINTRLRLYTDIGTQVNGNDRTILYNVSHPNIFTPRVGRYFYNNPSNNATSWINGSVDEVKVYNRELQANDITELYNQSQHGTGLGKAVIIFNYHGVNDTEAENGGSNLFVSQFTEQMEYLNSSGVKTTNYQEMEDWKNGVGIIPERSIIINFDDVYLSVYAQAKPIMDLYGFKGTFSLNTGSVGSSSPDVYGSLPLNWTQVNEMYDDGWEFISHGDYHNNSKSLTVEERITFFNDSRWSIRNNLSLDGFPKVFIYPWAISNDTINLECLEYYDYCVNLSVGFGTIGQYNHKNNINNFTIARMTSIGNSTALSNFKPVMGIYADQVLNLKLNENQGTIAYDTSGNGNNGTITGATWNTDGITVALTNLVDYTLTGATFTLVNSELAWEQIVASWNYNADSNTSASTIAHLIELMIALGIIAFIFVIIKFNMDKING